MEIMTTYIYKTPEGFTAYACGFEPEGKVEKTILLLNADDNKILKNKHTNVTSTNIVLDDIEEQDNYIEIDQPDEPQDI